MNLKISMISILIIYIVCMQSISCSPILPHINYDDAEVKGIPISLIARYIFDKILIKGGVAVNISLISGYIDVISIPDYLKSRLKAALNYIDEFNKTISITENEIDMARAFLKEKYLDLAENVLRKIDKHIYNASITLYKVESIIKDLSTTYPYLSTIIDPKINMLRERLEKCRSAYENLYRIFEDLNQIFINRTATIIDLNLSNYIVYPNEYINVSGILKIENGTRLSNKYLNIFILNTSISKKVRTDLNGIFRCMIRAPSTPGKYFVETYYIPQTPYLKYARNRIEFAVNSIETKIIVTTDYNTTLYPQQKLAINGFIETKIEWNNTDGEIVINLFKRNFKTRVVNGEFSFKTTIPYNIAEGNYSIALTYTPYDKALSKNYTRIPINIVNPPYSLSFEIDVPNTILNIFDLRIGFKPISSLQSNITVYLKISSNRKTIFNKKCRINVNESTSIHINIPYQIESGNYVIEITGIPENPLIKYRRERINIFILNINSLIICLITISFIAIYMALKIRSKPVYRERISEVLKPAVKSVVPAKTEELHISGKSLHKSILMIETIVSRILGIRIEPGDTHREICRKIYLKSPIIGELLLHTIPIFEKSYYGLKILFENELSMAKGFLQRIIQYLRRMRHG